MVISTESYTKLNELITDPAELHTQVEIIVNSTSVMDVHTHLFPADFSGLCLFGIDELLTMIDFGECQKQIKRTSYGRRCLSTACLLQKRRVASFQCSTLLVSTLVLLT
jgi:hypothetical protein